MTLVVDVSQQSLHFILITLALYNSVIYVTLIGI
jgi:hypothetical protein